MNLLFLTLNSFQNIEEHNIYSDLIKVFIDHGHKPFIVAPIEKKLGQPTQLTDNGDHLILRVQIGNLSGVSFIVKGISTILLENQFRSAIDKNFEFIHFDLILYSTPPITIAGVVKKLKQQHKALTYLMLKDIFPQNAIDLKLFTSRGFIYYYFRSKEKKLYNVSDHIGCMSPANVTYFLEHNKKISSNRVEVLPNAIIPRPRINRSEEKQYLRQKYNLPNSVIIYLLGGNVGKSQGIPFLVECLKDNLNKSDRFFIICGTGNEYHLLTKFHDQYRPTNVLVINGLSKMEYDKLSRGCDVGLIFLDNRFTIPNFPSRLLSYMENGMPIIACTDPYSDVGKIAVDNDFGFWCNSNDTKDFRAIVDKIDYDTVARMGQNARTYLENNYLSEDCYQIIISKTTRSK